MLLKPPSAVLETAAVPRRHAHLAIGAAIVLALLAPFLFYFDTARSIVAIWNSSETFAHGYIILPISLWLIWRRRENFSALPPQPYWPALGVIAVIGFGWLLARMGEVQVVMQYAFAALLPAIALAVLGRRLAWSLAFPLLFVLLAVPFGEVFIDPLINFTADFTVRALQATGIPVLRNGTRFDIPSGSWSVVEACSGVRYLISSITLGCLYAYLTYRSAARRAAFMLIAVLVPIVANGMRAYMIVMIGHLSGMKLAVGFDHLIYGWLFFGVVMFLMFWIGSYWREDPAALPQAPAETAALASGSRPVPVRMHAAPIVAVAVGAVVVSALWPLLAGYNDRITFNPAPVQLNPPALAWQHADAGKTSGTADPAVPGSFAWTPRFAPADAHFSGSFQPSAGSIAAPVDLRIFYYRNQHNGKALISSTNRLVNEKDAYHQINGSVRDEAIGTRRLAVREAELAGPAGNLLVWSWYWIDGNETASNYGGKLMQARAKLLFRGDDGAAILVSTPVNGDADAARARLRAFTADSLPVLETTLDQARKH